MVKLQLFFQRLRFQVPKKEDFRNILYSEVGTVYPRERENLSAPFFQFEKRRTGIHILKTRTPRRESRAAELREPIFFYFSFFLSN